jgi:hypothetical protein
VERGKGQYVPAVANAPQGCRPTPSPRVKVNHSIHLLECVSHTVHSFLLHLRSGLVWCIILIVFLGKQLPGGANCMVTITQVRRIHTALDVFNIYAPRCHRRRIDGCSCLDRPCIVCFHFVRPRAASGPWSAAMYCTTYATFCTYPWSRGSITHHWREPFPSMLSAVQIKGRIT